MTFKRNDGSSFIDAKPKRWNGSSWVDAVVQRWDGSKWVTTNATLSLDVSNAPYKFDERTSSPNSMLNPGIMFKVHWITEYPDGAEWKAWRTSDNYVFQDWTTSHQATGLGTYTGKTKNDSPISVTFQLRNGTVLSATRTVTYFAAGQG